MLTADEFDITSFLPLLVPGQNVLAVQCLNFTVNDPDAFISPELIATNVVGTGNVYFTLPTPGAANGNAYLGLVGDTKFSVDRGYCGTAHPVAITTATAGAHLLHHQRLGPCRRHVFTADHDQPHDRAAGRPV